MALSLDGYDERAFLTNEDKKRASAMTLINIGELVKNLSDEFRNEHKHIPWKEIAGFRDVAIHGYFTLLYTIIPVLAWVLACQALIVLVSCICRAALLIYC